MSRLAESPWLSIWVRPRETIRAIVEKNPGCFFPLLSWIYAFPILLQCFQNLSLGEQFKSVVLVGAAALLSPFVGMLGICIVSALLFWTGKWIGGLAPYRHIRAAMAWSNVPGVVTILGWGVLIGLFGHRVFLRDFMDTGFIGNELTAVFFVSLSQVVVSIWGFVIALKTLGEVQGFSAWKALLNILIPFFLVLTVVWVIAQIGYVILN